MKTTVKTQLTQPAKLKYDHPAGTKVTLLDKHTSSNSKEETFFEAPLVEGFFFEEAKKYFNMADEKRNEMIGSRGLINPKDASQGYAYRNTDAVFNFFSLVSIGSILLFDAVETATNKYIERTKKAYKKKTDFILIKLGSWSLRYKRETELNLEQMLYLGIDEKLKSVLPFCYDFAPPTQERFWASFKRLKSFRDSLIHIHGARGYGARTNQNSVFSKLIDEDFNALVTNNEQLIQFIKERCNQ